MWPAMLSSNSRMIEAHLMKPWGLLPSECPFFGIAGASPQDLGVIIVLVIIAIIMVVIVIISSNSSNNNNSNRFV